MIYNSRTDTDVCQDIIFIFCIFLYASSKKWKKDWIQQNSERKLSEQMMSWVT